MRLNRKNLIVPGFLLEIVMGFFMILSMMVYWEYCCVDRFERNCKVDEIFETREFESGHKFVNRYQKVFFFLRIPINFWKSIISFYLFTINKNTIPIQFRRSSQKNQFF